MKTKIQKLLTILLALPILFGIFGVVVFAETCDGMDEEDCQELIDVKSKWSQEADKLYKSFSDCLGICGFWDVSEWGQCSLDSEHEEDCGVVFVDAKHETDKSDPEKIQEALGEWRSELGLEVVALKVQQQSLKTINVKSLLSLKGQENVTDLKSFLEKAIDLLVKMVGLAAFVFLVIGGFRLVAAAGNDNEIQKAKTMLTYAIIGLVVALLAYIIVVTVQGILYR